LEASVDLALATLPSGEEAPGNRWIEGWVALRARLDVMTKKKILALARNSSVIVNPVASFCPGSPVSSFHFDYTYQFQNVDPNVMDSETPRKGICKT
jgi:hypothetical protein